MNQATTAQFYEIRVQGVLGKTLLTAFPALSHQAHDGVTALSGYLPDQAALHGVLHQIESLGLELLDVHRVG
jgi:hypothetical protein